MTPSESQAERRGDPPFLDPQQCRGAIIFSDKQNSRSLEAFHGNSQWLMTWGMIYDSEPHIDAAKIRVSISFLVQWLPSSQINKVRGGSEKEPMGWMHECVLIYVGLCGCGWAAPAWTHELVSVGTLAFTFLMQQISLKKNVKNPVWVSCFHFWRSPDWFWYE